VRGARQKLFAFENYYCLLQSFSAQLWSIFMNPGDCPFSYLGEAFLQLRASVIGHDVSTAGPIHPRILARATIFAKAVPSEFRRECFRERRAVAIVAGRTKRDRCVWRAQRPLSTFRRNRGPLI
jgi:hypothetical protein